MSTSQSRRSRAVASAGRTRWRCAAAWGSGYSLSGWRLRRSSRRCSTRRSIGRAGAGTGSEDCCGNFSAESAIPNEGGSSRRKIVTAYRQDALRCVSYLGLNGPTKAALVARATGVAKAGDMMRADHYGWFERPAGTPRGIYELTSTGRIALEEYADVVAGL